MSPDRPTTPPIPPAPGRQDPESPRGASLSAPPPATKSPFPGTSRNSLLAPVAFLYATGARLRARRWRGRARRLPKPVLSVGNLTFGGTGKTPLVIHACRELSRRGKRVAILSRGYRGGPGGNDEAKVIARHLPGVPHLQDPDRFAAGSRIVPDVDVFVLDDGFQHLPLHRDADIVLVDATDPFGGGFCPPAGRLREPVTALDRATLVLLTRCDLVDRASLGETMRTVRSHTASPVATSLFAPRCDVPLGGLSATVACGIGNPRAFAFMLERLGVRAVERRFYRDHHAYTPGDVASLAAAGRPVVVTEKDAVKLEPLWPPEPPLVVVRVEVEILDGAAQLAALFDRL